MDPHRSVDRVHRAAHRFPIGYTVFLSLTDSAGAVTRPFSFVGLENYIGWLTDYRAVLAGGMAHRLLHRSSRSPSELVIGLAIALLLRKTFRGQGLVRVFILLPLVATPVAVGMMWLLIFEPTIGFANT